MNNLEYWFNSSLTSLLRVTDQKGEMIPRIRTFLSKGGNINQRHELGMSLLEVAKMKKLDMVVKFLFAHKASEEKSITNFFVGNKITIFSESAKFITKMQCALFILLKKKTGKKLIDKVENGKHSIVIQEGSDNEMMPENRGNAALKGVGSSSKILVTGDSFPEFPFYIVLAHELIHAMHASYGVMKPFASKEKRGCVWTHEEEHATIIDSPLEITENAIRKEFRLKLRASHNYMINQTNWIATSAFSQPTNLSFSSHSMRTRTRVAFRS